MIRRHHADRRADAVVLMLAAAVCTRSAAGTIVCTTPVEHEVVTQSPVVTGCRRLPVGAYRVANHRLDDIRLCADAHRVLPPTGENRRGQIGEIFRLGTQMSVAFTPGRSPRPSYYLGGGGG